MPAQKIGMNVRLYDPLDTEAVGRSLLDVNVHVPLGVDHDGAPGCLIANEVRGVRQARKIVLR